jgi:hypothetical protein
VTCVLSWNKRSENAKLSDIKREMASVTNAREKAVRDAVENAPGHVARDNGLLAQIGVLEGIAGEDWKIVVVVIVIDAIAFALELSAVLARTLGYVPTTYDALVAGHGYMQVVRLVDEMFAELRVKENHDHAEVPAPEKHGDGKGFGTASEPDLFDSSNGPVPPPKRGRGRPRKHPPPG